MQSRSRPPICVGIFARTQCDSRLSGMVQGSAAIYARSWRELEARLASGAVQTALIDPLLVTPSDQHSIAAFRVSHPGIALIAYASLNGASLRALMRLNREGNLFHHVLIREREFPRSAPRRVIESATAHGLVNEVLGRLERDLSALPDCVVRTLVDLFARPGRYCGVSDLATESHLKIHTLYRSFQGAGLASPKKFLTLAKLCRACFLLCQSDASVCDVAMQVGYTRASTLMENCARVFGCTPCGLRGVGDQEELARRLLEWLCKPQRRDTTSSSRRRRQFHTTFVNEGPA